MSIRRIAVAATVAVALGLPAAPAPAQQGGTDPNRPHAAGKKTPPLAPAARDALSRALIKGRLTQAEYALHRVRSLFKIKRVRREFGDVEAPEGRDATMLFRDLALRADDLDGPERKAAEKLLARPDDKKAGDPRMPDGRIMKYGNIPTLHLCSETVELCVHWVEASGSEHRSTPTQAELTLTTLEDVWESQITLGHFRRPKADGSGPGPNVEYLDVYLANVGASQVYGYCTSDDPNLGKNGTAAYPYFDLSAYCVLDNNYAESFFGDPLKALQVTAAHEFFHAVQFAYDAFEDVWLMEGTATAIEDHVYGDINDNYQFLRASQLVKPHFPTDLTHDGSNYAFMNRYGAWLFWRFLSEHLGDPGVPDMSVLREVWERADASPTPSAPDDYSAKAAVKVAKSHGVPFKRLFADYGMALQLPEDIFTEGPGYIAFLDDVKRKTTHKAARLRPGTPNARRAVKINHLAHKYVAIKKSKAVATRRVRVVLDLPPRKRGSKATLLRFAGNGTFLGSNRIGLDAQGDGRIKIGSTARRAVIVLTNASTRFKECWSIDPRNPSARQVSCLGKPRDNGLQFVVKARLLN